MNEFQAGVTACLRSWSALKTAVESGWGGGDRESQAKAEDLRRNIFQIMDGSRCPIPNFDATDLADNLAIYMEEEFSVTLEDKSEVQLAEVIFAMYEGCCGGNPSLALEMISKAENALAFSSQHPTIIQKTEHDDEDDDEEMMTSPSSDPIPAQASATAGSNFAATTTTTFTPTTEYLANPLFGQAKKKLDTPKEPVRQLGEAAAADPVEEMDEDGFAPVKPKGRRRK